jgi:hypothetical protein
MTITIELKGPCFEKSVRRAQAYATKETAAVSLSVHRERNEWAVSWSWKRGARWTREHRRTRLSESEAGAFAAAKFGALVAWLERVEPQPAGLPDTWTC